MTDVPGQAPPVVQLPAGRLRGSDEGGIWVFKGVPYAEPPVGDLRWRAARPHPGWSGTRDATAFGPASPQPFLEGGDPVLGGHGTPPFDEDCLTLNVWTPAPDDARRPVLVWIHGGGFVSGSGALPIYSGETFARNGDLVVVTLNYRLGPLGYLSFEEDRNEKAAQAEPANLWFTDQLAALRWVHENIARFGGDPGNVTVAGQSGGAVSTAALAGHPEARRMFRRVILQSPPFGLNIPTRDEYRERVDAYRRYAGAKSLKELRGLPWERLAEATGVLFAHTARWGHWSTPFLPVRDGVTLRRHPAQTLLEEAAADIDVLIGWTREEANFAFALDPGYAAITRGQALDRIAQGFGQEEAADVYAEYARTRPGARPVGVLMDLITDELFRVPSLQLAEARAAAGRPVWAYQFDLPAPTYDGRLAAAHCLELPFVFDNFDSWSHAPLVAGIDPALGKGLTRSMHRAWIAFARTGDPNHADLPTWHRYRTDARTTMRFDSVTLPVDDLAGHARRLHTRRNAAAVG
ncbi:carboxylesterase/lipase family protein [Streptomyces katrae]|uniref:carboxylesterase/lipase family protein n=1 Tax=Streptomyces katrae TaxID=68223 RepID=UPI0009A52265|nr:carboxylesterase family protein [Streptomyces katrae]